MPRKSHLERIHRAADFYEPRMAVAFVRAMEQLQSEVSLERLADQIAHRGRVLLPIGSVEKAARSPMVVARRAALKGREIGHQVVEEATRG
jgi:hypothetical protein